MNDTLVDAPRGRADTVPGGRPEGARRLPLVPAAMARLRADLPERLWPTALVYGVISLVVTTVNSPGKYVGENRLEQYLNPARRLAKSLSVWDGASGIGGVREDFWPGTTLPIALLRGLGFGIIGTQRLWHAICLTIAAVGAVQVMRLFRRRIGVEHWTCGAIVAFGPFSAVFLIPSNLYFQYALGPWLLVAFANGVREARPWKWAGMFAVVTFAAGNVDAPGLIANLLPVIPAAVYLVAVERSTTIRRVVGWLARAFVLSLACGAASLAKTYFALDSLNLRLEQSESAATSALTSSWPETMRGLGNWLSYFAVGGAQVKPQHTAYFQNPLLVTLTFVPIVAAIAVLGWGTWRPKVMFGAMAVQSMVLMVGGFPASNPSRLGRMILWSMENIRVLKSFRNTYKLGLGVTLGTGALCGMAVVQAAERWKQRRGRTSRIPALLASVVVVGLALPFWSGHLYHPTETFSAVPRYWSEAFKFLDRFPFGGRSMILPATSRSQYRWGWVGDDVFDASLARAHPVSTGVPLSNPLAANLLEVLTLRMQDPGYRPGIIGPMARRLGITEIVLRNDLDWAKLGVARPALYQGLRTDPDLERVATFGAIGLNVTGAGDRSDATAYERLLAPVEVFRVKNPSPLVRIDAARPAVVVAGDGGAFPQLVAAGLLGADTPTVYSGSSSADQLVAELAQNGGIAVTDTNRRRVRTLVGYEPDYSATLPPGPVNGRPPRPLFPVLDGVESVTWFPDATRIDGVTNRLSGQTTETRPSLAFDHDPTTQWELNRIEVPYGRVLRVQLREPSTVSSMVLQSVMGETGSPTVTHVVARFADGVQADAYADRFGQLSAKFPAVTTDFIEFEILGYDIFSPTVGLVDVDVAGLDLREFVQLPDDLFQRADADPAVRNSIAGQPMAYLFERVRRSSYRMQLGFGDLGELRPDEEQALRRRFRTPEQRKFRIDGVGHLRPAVPDSVVNRLFDAPVTATSTVKQTDRLGAWGALAVDGDMATAWQAPSTAKSALTIRFGSRPISTVRVMSRPEFGFLPMRNVQVTIGSRTVIAPFRTPAGCADGEVGPSCTPVATASFGTGVRTDRLIVRVGDVPASFDLNADSVRIDEVELNGRPQVRLDPAAPLNGDCHDVGVELGGSPGATQAMPVRIAGTVGQLLSGTDVSVVSCDEFRLAAGWHVLESRYPLIDRVSMTTTDPAPQPSPPEFGSGATITEESAGEIRVRSATSRTARAVLVSSFDPQWEMSVNGGPYRASTAEDVVNTWDLAETGGLDLRFRYRPDVLFGWSFIVSLLGVAASLWLAFRRPRPVLTRVAAMGYQVTGDVQATPAAPDRSRAPTSRLGIGRGQLAAFVLMGGFGSLIIGPSAILLTAATVWLIARAQRVERLLATAALLMVTVAWLVSSLQARPELQQLSLGYTARRTAANEFGAVGGVLLMLLVTSLAWRNRQDRHPRSVVGAIRSLRRTIVASQLEAFRRAAGPAVVATTVAVVLGRWAHRTVVPTQYDNLLANLRRGSAYTLAAGFGPPALDAAPLGPSLRAFLPRISAFALVALFTLVAALMVYRHASLRGGRRAGLAALAVFSVLPATWGGSLAVVAAGLCALVAVQLAGERHLSAPRAFAVGLLLAAAILARPDAVAILVVVAVMWWRARIDRLALACGVLGVIIGVAPWANFVWSNGEGPWLTQRWSAMLADPFVEFTAGLRVQHLVGAIGLALSAVATRRFRVSTAGVSEFVAVGVVSMALGFVAVIADVGRDPLAWATPCVAVAVGVIWRGRIGSGRSAGGQLEIHREDRVGSPT